MAGSLEVFDRISAFDWMGMGETLRTDIPLFQPLTLRRVTVPNRVVISPMQQYNANADGSPTDWHFAHLTRLAIGGAGLVFTEALAVEAVGRLTYGDLGIWTDEHRDRLARLVDAMAAHGSVPGAQLIHAGRKASVQRPWEGYNPLGAAEAERGEPPWQTVSASAQPANPGWHTPAALTIDGIKHVLDRFHAATRRAAEAGFQALNIHGAHGYLIHSFLSPLSNLRDDAYGGDLAGRMRFAVEVADAVRAGWPSDRPLFYRLSCVDDVPGGWTLDETIALSHELGLRGVDVIDCSSGGLQQRTTTLMIARQEGYQVPYAERVKRDTALRTMAVGLIATPSFANDVVARGSADLVAIGRQALFNPHWPHHAARELGHDPSYRGWPPQYGWWLEKRDRSAGSGKTPSNLEQGAT